MKSSRTPKYEKVAYAIRKDISLGNYPTGSFCLQNRSWKKSIR